MRNFEIQLSNIEEALVVDYEATFGEIVDALAEVMFDKYYKTQFEKGQYSCSYEYMEATKAFLNGNDWVVDDLCETFEEEIKYYLYDAAFERYRNM